MVLLRGTISSGYGKASEIMSMDGMLQWYEEVLKHEVVPGTMNIELDSDFLMPEKGVICAKSPLSRQKFYYLPVKLFGRIAWIMRPERHPFTNNIIELIATEHILTTYGLKKGDVIEIEVE